MDGYGNPLVSGLPYAHGEIIASTADEFAKMRAAWRMVARRIENGGVDQIFNLSGLERSLPYDPTDPPLYDDELAPALHIDRLLELGLEHLGGIPERHDIMVMNRLTASLFAAILVLARSGDTIIGVSARHSHPALVRSAERVGAKFVDTRGPREFEEALDRYEDVSMAALTRLTVSYELLPTDDIHQIVELAHQRGAKVLIDDAGGARVGPAVFDQPLMLELGVDVGATGLDKYGTVGPRLGLLGGKRDLVEEIRSCAFGLGLEARPMLYPAVVRSLETYDPARVRELVATTKGVAGELKKFLGERMRETPVTAQLSAEDILEIAKDRASISHDPIVPYEATASLAMLLLRDFGVLTVHFAGFPPGTSSLLFKFIPPETLERFGGAEELAKVIDQSLDSLAELIDTPEELRRLLVEGASGGSHEKG